MSDSATSIQGNGTTNAKGVTVKTPYDNSSTSVSVEDFLQLMIASMTNQDFLSEGGGTDSTVYVTQLAQITTMQQMQELAYYSKTNYVTSMVGKEVTVATLGLGAQVKKDVGVVERVTLDGDDFTIYVNGKGYKLSEVMDIRDAGTVTDPGLAALPKTNLILMDYDETSAVVRWDVPKTEDPAVAKKISYDVYYSTSPDFSTVEEIEKGTLAGSVKAGNDCKVSFGNLESDTRYYVNVIAKTPDGKKYAYQKLVFTTKAE